MSTSPLAATGKLVIAKDDYERLIADVAKIEGALEELADGYQRISELRGQLAQEAYRLGGTRALDDLNEHFSGVVIRDRMAAALYRAGLGEVLDVGSGKDDSVFSFVAFLDRFFPGNEYRTGR